MGHIFLFEHMNLNVAHYLQLKTCNNRGSKSLYTCLLERGAHWNKSSDLVKAWYLMGSDS